MPLTAVVFGGLTNIFAGLEPGALGVVNIPTVAAFNSQISKQALNFVYIGIVVLASMFFGSLFWTISGERISRRIRGYVVSASF